jgi:YD repeat-containing protein
LLVGTGQSLRAIGYTYDAVGNMLTVTDPDAKYTYGYDALNRISSVDNAGTIGVPAPRWLEREPEKL